MRRSEYLCAAVAAVAVVVAVAAWGGRAGGQAGDPAGLPAAAGGPAPAFVPTPGKHYQIYLPDNRGWPGAQSPVLVRKVFSNGWVEVKTREDQTAWINLNHAMQLYQVDAPAPGRPGAGHEH